MSQLNGYWREGMTMNRARMYAVAAVVALAAVCEGHLWAQQIASGSRLRVVSPAPVKLGREILGTLSQGTEVVALDVKGDWIYVEADGLRGWVHATRVEQVVSPDDGEAPADPPNGKLLELLASYMDRLGYRYLRVEEPGQREGIIVTAFTFVNEGFSIQVFIDPVVEKGCLLMKAPRLFQARMAGNPERLTELLKAIGYINYSIILGKFCYDPRDGEVSFEVNIAIDDIVVSFRQFEHCLIVLCGEIQDKLPKLKAIWDGQCNADVFYSGTLILPVTPQGPVSGTRTAAVDAFVVRRHDNLA